MTDFNVVLYARFSSNNQREESIDAQLRAMHRFCDANGYNIVGEYRDEAKTGTNANREEFQRMIADAKLGKFNAVIVHKLDRFSRRKYDSYFYKSLLLKHKVQLISVLENIDNSPEGRMMEGMIETWNAYYVDNLSRETMKGLRENAYKCEWTGGIPPLGYDVINKKLVINEHEAEAVRIIFNMLYNGYGYGQIIKKLNALGYRTKRGGHFGKNSIYDLIANEKYKGVFTYNKHSRSKVSMQKKSSREFNDESEIIRIEGGCPQIVSKKIWDRVNKLRKTVNRRATQKHPYLLSGLITCEECQSKFQGNTRNSNNKNKQYTTYRCGGRVNKKICSCVEIRCELLDSWVIDEFFSIVFTDENIPIIAKRLNKSIKEDTDTSKEYKQAKENLKKLEKGLNSLIDTVTLTGTNSIITKRIKELKSQISSTEEIIKDYEKSINGISVTEEDIKKDLEKIRQYMKNPESLEKTKYVLSQYIDSIVIGNKTIKATFKVAFWLSDKLFFDYTHIAEIGRKELRRYWKLGTNSWLYHYIGAINGSYSPKRTEVLDYAAKHFSEGQSFYELPFDVECKNEVQTIQT